MKIETDDLDTYPRVGIIAITISDLTFPSAASSCSVTSRIFLCLRVTTQLSQPGCLATTTTLKCEAAPYRRPHVAFPTSPGAYMSVNGRLSSLRPRLRHASRLFAPSQKRALNEFISQRQSLQQRPRCFSYRRFKPANMVIYQVLSSPRKTARPSVLLLKTTSQPYPRMVQQRAPPRSCPATNPPSKQPF